MKVAVFSAQRYDRELLAEANADAGHELRFFEDRLDDSTVPLTAGCGAVCVFVNDQLDAAVLAALGEGGTHLVALRATGFNNVDLIAAARNKVRVVRVAEYSAYSVAEHAVALLLALRRHIHRAYNRTRDGNFALDGLLGSDLHGCRVGVVGTGKIGSAFAAIMKGFGCEIVGHDKYPNAAFESLGARYTSFTDLASSADVVSLHCPLTPETRYLVDERTLSLLKPGAILINTSRGGLIDTEAAIGALKTHRLGALGIDVYEQESGLFFHDRSSTIIRDDVIQRLVSFPNVIVTGHQAFFTREAMGTICTTTIQSISAYERGETLVNEVRA